MTEYLSTASKTKVRPILCTVTSDKMNRSRVAFYTRVIKHPHVKKYIKRRSKLMFHDENNQTKNNDQVLVVPSRPLSARKRFTLLKIIKSGVDLIDNKE